MTLPPPPPPISFTNNPINLLDSDEEEIPILPEIQEEITNDDSESSSSSTNIEENTPPEATPNVHTPSLPEIGNSQQSIRTTLSFGSNTTTTNIDNVLSMRSPFAPTREIPRSPVNRVLRRGFHLFNN